jgi:DNA polymerase elongation subunit (family B)
MILTTSYECKCYGAILNPGCRFNDHRIGQSTTLTGRIIAKHMHSVVNECITGEYDHVGTAIIYGDTDSTLGSTTHVTNRGVETVEKLFEDCTEFWSVGTKEYAYDPTLEIMTYDPNSQQAVLAPTEYIYRHPVSKAMYEIEDELGNVITVTEDHSVMVQRDGQLVEARPQDIQPNDLLVSVMPAHK